MTEFSTQHAARETRSGSGSESDGHTHPSGPWILLNPGPVSMHESVRDALRCDDMCHREPEFMRLLSGVRDRLVGVAMGDDRHAAVVLTGSGTAALESVLVSAAPPEGRVLVLDNGTYGERIRRIALAHSIPHAHMRVPLGTPFDPAMIERALREDPSIQSIALAHHETSTGMLNDLNAIGHIATAGDCELIVDAISSIGAEPLDIIADHVTWCVGSSNKCIEGPPGLSFVVGPHDAFRRIATRTPGAFYLDLGAHYTSQYDTGAPLFTPAVHVMHAFDRALRLLAEETLGGRQARYAERTSRLREGLVRLGISITLDPPYRSRVTTVAKVPPGWTFAELHDACKAHRFIIYPTTDRLGDVFRISTMGTVDHETIDAFLDVLSGVLASRAGGAA